MTRIALVCPGKPILRERADAVLALAEAEFPRAELCFSKQCFEHDGHFAGSDDARLEAFVNAANDAQYDAVWFAMGGYGAARIAADAMARLGDEARDKTYLGYSDAGVLLSALYRDRIGTPVHGPLAGDVRREGGDDAIRRVLRYLSGQETAPEPLDAQPTVAFNLMTLAMLVGTDLMPDLSGHVVMVEEVAEHLYAIDRLFFHVTQHLRGCAGIRLGRITEVPKNDRPFGCDEVAIAQYWCDRSGIPYLGRADIGHDAANRIVPFGVEARASRS
ncbi:LD-carboxypeptidase [Altererythrobacter salegens]|uniref:LD-carboxypeptidase n=1 Tax=Croceibacterium salegens TaxID=1737568 RepID=A0A6I4SSY2_9SPHN|nr:LD-carboxypeptidase [Croceibacterium salegens]MXO59111.1 LD-carboxypeptidase [Croceibacterium salegens]